MASNDSSSSDGRRTTSGTRARSAAILLVEDNDDERELYEAELSRAGHRVIATPSAEAALMIMKNQRIDVLVTDYGLPLCNGAALIERARVEGVLSFDTPAFICTVRKDIETPPGVALLEKPIGAEDLATIVMFVLARAAKTAAR